MLGSVRSQLLLGGQNKLKGGITMNICIAIRHGNEYLTIEKAGCFSLGQIISSILVALDRYELVDDNEENSIERV